MHSATKPLVFVSTFFGRSIGGAEISVELLFESLKKKGIPTFLVTAQKAERQGVIPLHLSWVPKKIFILGNFLLDRYLLRRLYQVIKSVHPRIIHVQDIFMLPAAVRLGEKLSVPVVVTVRDNLPREYKIFGINLFTFRNQTYRKSLLRCNAIIAISTSIKKNLLKFSIPEEKIHVIHNMVKVSSDFRREVTKISPTPVVLALGRLYKEKGFHVLLESLALIDKNKHPFLLRLVGKGPEQQNLMILAKRLGIENNVEFLPWVEYQDVGSLYSGVDFVVFPSIYEEPLGRVALEAAIFSKPIIASDVGGIVEVVERDVSGLLVPPNDSKKLSEAILYLLCNESVRVEMGAKATLVVEKKFSEEVILKNVLNLYETL